MIAQLEDNLHGVRSRIAAAARAAGRPAEAVQLVAVTKSVPPEVAAALRRLGQADLGESRVDALEAKAEHFAREGLDARWHFVGHLQRNKARRVLRLARTLHSVDGGRLLDELERLVSEGLAAEEGVRPDVYLQVNLTDEDAKHGAAPDALAELAARCVAAPHLRLAGLMAMGPTPGPDGAPRPGAPSPSEVFRRLAQLARALEADPRVAPAGPLGLSMGMSGDFEEAVAAGADVVRVGSDLFRGVDLAARRAEGPGA